MIKATSKIFGGFRALAVLAVLLSLVTSACDTDVEPFLGDREPPIHVVNGVLDAARDTQFVRVQRIKRSIEPSPAVLDEMNVVSSALGFASITWRDSIIVLDDGSTGHLFFAVFRPEAGVEYRLRVSDAIGMTRVETTVPPDPDLELFPPSGNNQITQTVAFNNRGEPPPNLHVVYDVSHLVTLDRQVIAYSYRTFGRSLSGRWEFDVLLSQDRSNIDDDFELAPRGGDLRLHAAYLRFELWSSEWETAETSTEPGFFGSIGVYEVSLELPDSVRAKLRFVP